jgi:hypothetical protein
MTLESTDEIAVVNGGQARVWIGETEDGTPVKAWIATIQPQTHDPARLKAFDEQLREMRCSPRSEIFDLRLLID